MRTIAEFKLIDTRLEPISRLKACWNLKNHIAVIHGYGTDAESALDTLLHNLEVNGFDPEGMEARIKAVWTPSEEEGNFDDTQYHLYLCIGEVA
jgi:hypothetical protein